MNSPYLRLSVFLVLVIGLVLGDHEAAGGITTRPDSTVLGQIGHPPHGDDPEVAPPTTAAQPQGLWVFTDEMTESTATGALLDYAADHSHNRLYVSVYRSHPNARGQLLYEHDLMRRFIEEAHERDMEVWAAYGDPGWPALGCSEGSFPCERIREILSYNADNADAAFDGVMLDVEPEKDVDLPGTLVLFKDILQMTRQERLPIATSISAFWNADVVNPYSGTVKPAFQHALDLPFDHVLVMCYRNFADGTNGAIDLCEDEMLYAEEHVTQAQIVLGLRTTTVEVDGGWKHESFAGMEAGQIHETVQAINRHFQHFGTFSGVAFHRYQREGS